MTTESPRWYKSSYSDNGGQCIEVAANLIATHGIVPVRDSKNPGGPALHVPADAFSAFVASVKAEDFGTV
ncbi:MULTISPECIES: DUF397 domain-containing protein [unclassified Streptomyces]|uniref:DUF397 domain-containing protein n=1 Tax=unclassified Streptomyces TaxID=2593676 RepID=UPI0022B5F08B|nr:MULTISPECIES: DUF397 domain-containing protein [unclassified Streptomyces]MCZ7414619.1 DUF397 domain-containing protein [Streptomyces sp. WMMC897]MCZ7431548.1 DUF397 domain-containing protein [Streptomyces sp. WMMC1477]